MSKRIIYIGLFVVVIALAVGGFFYLRQRATSANTAAANLQTTTVQRGTVTSAVSTAGTITTPQSATITWTTAGIVSTVNVKVGQVVKTGDVLMALDQKSLDHSYVQAEADLLSAQDALNTLLAGPTAQQLAQAKLDVTTNQQAVTTAERNLNNVMNPVGQSLFDSVNTAQAAFDAAQTNSTLERVSADATAVQTALNTMNLAYSQMQRAQANLDDCIKQSCAERPSRENALTSTQNALTSAQNAYNTAKLSYDAKVESQGVDLGTAQKNLDQAKANLAAAQKGPDPAKVALYQAQLDIAKANYQASQQTLTDLQAPPKAADVAAAQAKIATAKATVDTAQVLAPFTGTVLAVYNKPGDSVTNATTAIVMADLSAFQLQVDVSEVDINNIQIGQTVDLTVDAAQGQTFTGQVSAILALGKSTQGVVTFPVTVIIPNPDPTLKSGMTAAASIITAQHTNVLTVPNRAIRAAGGQRTVTVLFEGQQIPVPVTVGLTGDTVSEIVDNGTLKEGDTLVINQTTTTTNTGGGGGFGGGFGGGGGFRPGGG